MQLTVRNNMWLLDWTRSSSLLWILIHVTFMTSKAVSSFGISSITQTSFPWIGESVSSVANQGHHSHRCDVPWALPSASKAPNRRALWIRTRGGGWGSSTARAAASSTTASASTIDSYISAENWALLSERGRAALHRLIEHDQLAGGQAQRHVYGDWPAPGTDDDGKRRLAEQIADLDDSYPGGLTAYLTKAKVLLKESADGVNPFDEYEAVVPQGESLHFHDMTAEGDQRKSSDESMSFAEAEQGGLEVIGGAVFVLVAGGLGERLGYSGIKLSLETNLCTSECYLELYIRYIQALQYLARQKGPDPQVRIPLVIMTSGDTDPLTRKLLDDNDYYGMDRDMLTIVTQDKVAALKDGSAGLALEDDDRWSVQTKPHGHGDVHHLLFREGLVDRWEQEGRQYVVFLQDTNALVINSLIPTLGVSKAKGFHMNSICIPRLAGEAAGAIARLEHKTDPSKSLVINVEYNQLDPLLRTQGDCQGDVPDPATGYSPFPGNANNLVLEVTSYAKTLRGEDQGVVLEFVNPKYKDDTRTDFKKPTRLECMMQDIPKLFQKELGTEANIGFTMFDRWFTFSPAKNALDAGQAAVAKGSTAPGTMSSAESDLYIQNQRKLHWAGADLPVTEETDLTMMAGIPVTPGPRLVLAPSWALTRQDLSTKIQGPIRITQRSSVILSGPHVTIKQMEVDGALIIQAGLESHVTVDGLVVKNAGWQLQELDPQQEYPEHVRIRGYTLSKTETAEFVIHEPGHFVLDGTGQIRPVPQE